jgi:hypothetical protein
MRAAFVPPQGWHIVDTDTSKDAYRYIDEIVVSSGDACPASRKRKILLLLDAHSSCQFAAYVRHMHGVRGLKLDAGREDAMRRVSRREDARAHLDLSLC